MSTATPSLRDSLKKRLSRTITDLDLLDQGKTGLPARKTLVQQRRSLEQRLERLTNESTDVSDHALVRYMERVHGIDMDEIRKEIVGFDHKTRYLPSGHYRVNGHKIRVKNGVVVTVVTKDSDKD